MKYFKRWEREKKKNQPRILYSAKLSFKNEREIKTFSDKKEKLTKCIARPALQEMLEEFLQNERKWYRSEK